MCNKVHIQVEKLWACQRLYRVKCHILEDRVKQSQINKQINKLTHTNKQQINKWILKYENE